MANTIIQWLIGFTFMLFAVLFAIAGFKLVTSGGNTSAMSAAKDSLVNALIGLLLILAAWLIVDTLMKAVLKGDAGEIDGWGPWAEVKCFYALETLEYHYHEDDSTATTTVGSVATSTGTTTGTFMGSGANCPPATEAEVVTIPGTSYKALPGTAANFVKMREAAARDGITLRVTSGWRSDATQVRLFEQLCPGGTCGSKKAARPCSLGGNGSNHNSGEAIDISVGCQNGQTGCNTPTYRWLKENGGAYGFNNNLPSDPLHWSPSGR